MSWHGCGVCAELRAVKMCGGRFRVEVGWETRLGLGAKMVRSHGCGLHMSASFWEFHRKSPGYLYTTAICFV
jgi:hypothetical protein